MLTWITIAVLGILIGWIAAVIADARIARDLLSWIAAGLIAAILGGALLTPWLGGGAIVVSGFSLPNLLLSMLGAVPIPAIALAFRRRRRTRPVALAPAERTVTERKRRPSA